MGTTLVDGQGDLVATLVQVGNGRQVPRNCLVYWGLRNTDRERRQFQHKREALAWVRGQFPDVRVVGK